MCVACSTTGEHGGRDLSGDRVHSLIRMHEPQDGSRVAAPWHTVCTDTLTPHVQGLHSPEGEDALVLNEAEWRGGQTGATGRRPCAVVVDPYVCRSDLRVLCYKDVVHADGCLHGKPAVFEHVCTRDTLFWQVDMPEQQ